LCTLNSSSRISSTQVTTIANFDWYIIGKHAHVSNVVGFPPSISTQTFSLFVHHRCT
jgi:hypothetical protein